MHPTPTLVFLKKKKTWFLGDSQSLCNWPSHAQIRLCETRNSEKPWFYWSLPNVGFGQNAVFSVRVHNQMAQFLNMSLPTLHQQSDN